MLYGISGAPIPAGLLYAYPIQTRCAQANFWPCVAYAIACNETILGEYGGKWNAATVVSSDGGHGLFQLTSSYPDDWMDVGSNTEYAIEHFFEPDLEQWRQDDPTLVGDDLVRCLAASFNAGFGGAWQGHERGNVDAYDTDGYGARALAIYKQLITGTFQEP